MCVIYFVIAFASTTFHSFGFTDCKSSLTHTLPYINHRIQKLCEQDFLWRTVLLRLLKREPYLWEEGVHRVLKGCRRESRRISADTNESVSNKKQKLAAQKREGEVEENGESPTSQRREPKSEEKTKSKKSHEESLIDNTVEQMILLSQKQCQSTSPKQNKLGLHITKNKSHLCLFQQTVSTHLRQTHPIFYMPGTVRLGCVFGLHFFEPRYRVLISEVMSSYPVGFRTGDVIDASTEGRFPEFVYAHVAPLAPTNPACIVQVRQCHIYPDGTADVLLMPVAYVWMERVWERPNSGGLACGRVVRMGKEASRALERSLWGSTRLDSADWETNGHGNNEEEDEDDVIVDGEGVRGSIHAILAYLAAREQGMQEFENSENNQE
uniref:Lon N-terminal domain-containing protein n=1 Tax=Ditylum brightwellii TaxID=49249 RepID=A0A6V2A4W5_9STRA|mmetsp:Transcript_9677/g.14331  ORF Transcript_9677/g.14331 Transcript_9677/m.14331 type:complete len:381 (+) Transcript_9677:311-1453(+)